MSFHVNFNSHEMPSLIYFLADNSNEMPSLIFSENYKKKRKIKIDLCLEL